MWKNTESLGMPRIQNEHTATFHFRPGGMFMRIPQTENLVQMKLYWCLNNIVHTHRGTHGAISTAPRSFPGRQSCDSADLVPSTEAGVVTDDTSLFLRYKKKELQRFPSSKVHFFRRTVVLCNAAQVMMSMCVAKVPFLCKHSHLRISDCLREYWSLALESAVQEAAGFVWDKKQDDVKILAALSYVLLGLLQLEIATLPQTWTGLEKIKD